MKEIFFVIALFSFKLQAANQCLITNSVSSLPALSEKKIRTPSESDIKLKGRPISRYLRKDEILKWPLRKVSKAEREGLLDQSRALSKTHRRSQVAKKKDLLFVVKCLLKEDKRCKENDFGKKIRAYRLSGTDGSGSVQFTGYFVPVIMARKQKSAEFPYPIFKRPKDWRKNNGPHATREEIDKQGILDGRGLEIGYTNRPLAIFSMQMQGSGIAKFADGTEKLLTYDGKNGHEYVNFGPLLIEDGHLQMGSISLDDVEAFFKDNPLQVDKYLYQNPSFVFFKSAIGPPKGAAGVKLTAGHSIAVDPSIIPLGAVLIGKVPKLDDRNRAVGHELRLLFAQDTGNAIEGPGHVDLFLGTGPEAKNVAKHLQHYGELWLLLPN